MAQPRVVGWCLALPSRGCRLPEAGKELGGEWGLQTQVGPPCGTQHAPGCPAAHTAVPSFELVTAAPVREMQCH